MYENSKEDKHGIVHVFVDEDSIFSEDKYAGSGKKSVNDAQHLWPGN